MPRGSVLSPTLFNIYTNDQPVHDGTRSFIYAHDLSITAQFPTFSQVESTIEEALGKLTEYYRNSSLRANPDKTQVTAFHLRNGEAKTSLKVSSNGVDLENTTHPKYLGVTLDRTLSYKQHIQNQDKGSYPQQPFEEISYLKMWNKCKHYKNNSTGHVLRNSRMCCSSMGEIYIRRHIGRRTNSSTPSYHRMHQASICGRFVFVNGNRASRHQERYIC